MVSAVAGAALIALVVVFKRRRVAKRKVVKPHDVENLEQGRDQPQPPPPPPYVGNGGDESPCRQHNASPEAESSAEKSLTVTTASHTTASPPRSPTRERAEHVKLHHKQGVADVASVPGGRTLEDIPGGDNVASSSADDIGLGHAVLAAAQELAHHCLIPGVSEAAAAVCIMANLVTDSRDLDSAGDSRLRMCRSIVAVLTRAAKVIAKVNLRGFSVLCCVVVCGCCRGGDSHDEG